MIHTVSAQFLIVLQHPEKSKLIASDLIRNTGIIGAIMLDLLHHNCIRIEHNKVTTIATETNLSLTHLQVLYKLNSSTKNRTIKHWISKLSKHSSRFVKQLYEDLEQERIIQIFRKKFLFIPYYKTLLYDTDSRFIIIKEIRELISTGVPLVKTHPMLPSIIHTCNLHKVIAYGRSERKTCRKQLTNYVQNDAIAQSTGKVITQMQNAISGAVTVAVATSVSSGS